MGKNIDAVVQAAIDSKNYTAVVLCRMEMGSPYGDIRLCNAGQSIYWDEGSGEVEYVGVGGLASINAVPETNELSGQTIQLTLSGVPVETLNQAWSEAYAGKPVYLWYATLNPDTYAVHADTPILFFAGMMDFANVEFGETATVTMNATSRLSDWERPIGGRFNHSYQRTYVDSTDTGFKDMVALQNRSVAWGTLNQQDPNNTNTYNTTPVTCFEYGTKFIMADNSLKEIQDIKVEDTMLYGGTVYSTSIGYGKTANWYDYGGVAVTGDHQVLEDSTWINVRDSLKAISIEPRDRTYILTNENQLMIAENKIAFSDYNGFPEELWASVFEEQTLEYQNSREELNKELEKLKL